jgi:argininosuccinate lyase
VLKGVPFRNAHEKVGRIVRYCLDSKKPLTSLTLEEWQTHIPEVGEDLLPLLSPRRSVERRNTLGGTSPDQVKKQIEDISLRLMMFDREAQEFRDRIPEGY